MTTLLLKTWGGFINIKHSLYIFPLLFGAMNIISDKEGHFITTKGSIHQETITTLEAHAPDIASCNMCKTKLIKL